MSDDPLGLVYQSTVSLAKEVPWPCELGKYYEVWGLVWYI